MRETPRDYSSFMRCMTSGRGGGVRDSGGGSGARSGNLFVFLDGEDGPPLVCCEKVFMCGLWRWSMLCRIGTDMTLVIEQASFLCHGFMLGLFLECPRGLRRWSFRWLGQRKQGNVRKPPLANLWSISCGWLLDKRIYWATKQASCYYPLHLRLSLRFSTGSLLKCFGP